MTQRPDLFGACLPAVGVMDMLRFHKFTEGRYWVDDYGSSDDPERVQGPAWPIRPITTSSRARCYPATLVTTADTDDRVVPGHSFKFAAALQHAQAGDAPGADPHLTGPATARESRSASGSKKSPTSGRSCCGICV